MSVYLDVPRYIQVVQRVSVYLDVPRYIRWMLPGMGLAPGLMESFHAR